jgi:uncharacterized membrane protein
MGFAITLLVVDIAVQPPGSPAHQFFRAWPSYLAYLVSFLTIGAAWIAHQSLTDRLERVDEVFLRLNLLFLVGIAFLPFPTRLVVEALGRDTAWQRLAAVVYGVTLLLIRVLFAALAAYFQREHLRKPGPDDADLVKAHNQFRWVVLSYALTIVLAFFIPEEVIFLYFGISIYLFVPFRAVARDLFGWSPKRRA